MPGYDQYRMLQYAWFTLDDTMLVNFEQSFQACFGFQLDNLKRIRPPQAPTPTVVGTAVKDGVEFAMQATVMRTDIVIQGAEEPQRGRRAQKNIDGLLIFHSIAENACRIIKSNRQSMIMQAARTVPTVEDLGSVFAEVLQTEAKLEGASEFIFQMNRRYAFDDIEINRVLKWEGEISQLAQIQFGQATFAPVSRVIEQSCYLTYLMDINTVPSSEIRGEEQQKQVLAVLKTALLEASEIDRIGQLI